MLSVAVNACIEECAIESDAGLSVVSLKAFLIERQLSERSIDAIWKLLLKRGEIGMFDVCYLLNHYYFL